MPLRERFPIERLLVATDGEPAADAPLLVTKVLAERHGAEVEVIGVFSPRIPVPPLTMGSGAHRCEPHDRGAVAAFQQRVLHQLRDRVGVEWPLHVRVGHPPLLIAAMAQSSRPSLVVLGHTMPAEGDEHRPGRHTAEQVTIGCDVPVLAVPPGMSRLPRVCLAVSDDSSPSQQAWGIAAALLAEGGTLQRLESPVCRELLHVATVKGADLIALPLHGDTPAIRALMGGCVMDVLDHAKCAVLITRALRPAAADAAPAARQQESAR